MDIADDNNRWVEIEERRLLLELSTRTLADGIELAQIKVDPRAFDQPLMRQQHFVDVSADRVAASAR
jgi:hypothetical protein